MILASFEIKGVWIDAKHDRRPMTEDWVRAIIDTENFGRIVTDACYFLKTGWSTKSPVIAWMPKSEPYNIFAERSEE